MEDGGLGLAGTAVGDSRGGRCFSPSPPQAANARANTRAPLSTTASLAVGRPIMLVSPPTRPYGPSGASGPNPSAGRVLHPSPAIIQDAPGPKKTRPSAGHPPSHRSSKAPLGRSWCCPTHGRRKAEPTRLQWNGPSNMRFQEPDSLLVAHLTRRSGLK